MGTVPAVVVERIHNSQVSLVVTHPHPRINIFQWGIQRENFCEAHPF